MRFAPDSMEQCPVRPGCPRMTLNIRSDASESSLERPLVSRGAGLRTRQTRQRRGPPSIALCRRRRDPEADSLPHEEHNIQSKPANASHAVGGQPPTIGVRQDSQALGNSLSASTRLRNPGHRWVICARHRPTDPSDRQVALNTPISKHAN